MSKVFSRMRQNKPTILAIDPGYDRLGMAVLKENTLIYSTCIQTRKTDSHEKRLLQIGNEIERAVKAYRPDLVAVEKLFWGTNQKTALAVGESRGVILFVAAKNSLPIFEYSPIEIKIAVTGYGRSTKDQIMKMVPKIIRIEKNITSDDEFDAIAVGITCLSTYRMGLQK